MIIYNVTILITKNREDEFVNWMKNEHIAQVLETGIFEKAIFFKLIDPLTEENAQTYATQYFCRDESQLERYYNEYAPQLREEGVQKFGQDMLGFRTVLEQIQEFYPTH